MVIGQTVFLSTEIPYAGDSLFYFVGIQQDGIILQSESTTRSRQYSNDKGIVIAPFVKNVNETGEANASIYFNEYDINTFSEEFNSIFYSSSEFNDYNEQDFTGVYLFTWVYDFGNSDVVTSQLALFYNDQATILVEARSICQNNPSSGTIDLLEYVGYTDVVDGNNTLCSSVYYPDNSQDSTITVHERTDYLVCSTIVDSHCVDSIPPVNTVVTHVFISRGTFGDMAGKIVCPDGYNFTLISDGLTVSAENYEILECLYDSDYYAATWSQGEYECKDPEYVSPILVRVWVGKIF